MMLVVVFISYFVQATALNMIIINLKIVLFIIFIIKVFVVRAVMSTKKLPGVPET